MMEIGIFEALTFILLSAVKILFTPIGMIAAGYSYWTTIVITSFGGVLGCVVFFYLLLAALTCRFWNVKKSVAAMQSF